MLEVKMEVPLHMAEWTLMPSNQQTTFWKVLWEDGENVDSLDGSLGDRFGLAPHSVEKEQSHRSFIKDKILKHIEKQALLKETQHGFCKDDGKRTRLQVKNSQLGGKEPVEIPRTGRQKTQETLPVTAEIQEEKCEANSAGTEPHMECKESGDFTEGLGVTCISPSPVDTEGEASFSKGVRTHRLDSGLVFEHSGEECSVVLEEENEPKSKLAKHHSTEETNNDCPEFGVRFHSYSLPNYQINHTGEKTYRCSSCGKSFSRRSDLLRHEMIHTGKKPHQCPECGKSFSQKSTLLSHQIIHSGKKPYECLECGKNFSRRSQLLIHQMIHTGEKPHKCPSCGKSFSTKSDLIRHDLIHTGKKPHQCLVCGRSFSQKSTLLTHQVLHTGEKPHKCPTCGKSFSRKTDLLSHQKTHTESNLTVVLCV